LDRIGPDGSEVTGPILSITEKMVSLPQPVTYTCIARNQVDMADQQQHQQQRVYRRAANRHEAKLNVTFTVGQYTGATSFHAVQ